MEKKSLWSRAFDFLSERAERLHTKPSLGESSACLRKKTLPGDETIMKGLYYQTGKETKMDLLKLVMERGSADLLRAFLKEFGDELNLDEDCGRGRKLMHLAAMREGSEWMEELIARGSSIIVEDSLHMTPLFYAAKAGRIENARFLLKSGASASHRDVFGNGAFRQIAGRPREVEFAELLTKFGAEPSGEMEFFRAGPGAKAWRESRRLKKIMEKGESGEGSSIRRVGNKI